jgi:carboxylesterase
MQTLSSSRIAAGLARMLDEARSDGVEGEANLPFYLPATLPRRGGLLMVHGFSASPWEVRQTAAELAASGWEALAVRLPGHGTSPEDLAHRKLEEWEAAVCRGYELLAPDGPPAALGVSTGALLLAQLAARSPLAGLILLSPFLRLRHRLSPWVDWLRHLQPYQVVEVPARLQPYYYHRRPLAAIHQLNRLLRRLPVLLPQVGAPTLVINGRGDQTIDLASARELVRRLGSLRLSEHLLGPEVPHVLTTKENPRRDVVMNLIRDFLDELAPEPGGRRGP